MPGASDMSRNVSSETPINSGIMCNNRLKINRHIAITFENVAKNLSAGE